MRSKGVLLVDDNELLLSGMKRFFEREFDHIMTASTGKEALSAIQGRFYPLVVLDVHLPDMSGCEVLEYIKRASPDSMVVIITSDGEEKTRNEAFRKGAFEFLEKPFDVQSLRNVLSRARFHFESEMGKPPHLNDFGPGLA